MSILRKLSDVLKEVFWIKNSKSSKKTAKKSSTRPALKKKKAVKKTVKKQKAPKLLKPSKRITNEQPPLKKPKESVLKAKAASVPKVKKVEVDPNLVKIGEVTHYFDRIKVCVVKITHGTVLIGDKLTFLGQKSKFVQKVWSMQIESEDVKVAKKGQLIGVKVDKPVVVGDVVYK